MLVHHPDPQPDRVLGPVNLCRLAVEKDLACVAPDQPIDDVHQRRLSGAVLPKQGVNLAPFDDQVHAIVRPQAAEGLDDPSELERGRARFRS